MEILQNPVLYVALEVIAIAVMGVFIVRWNKDHKKWKKAQEEHRVQEQEAKLLRALTNERRHEG